MLSAEAASQKESLRDSTQQDLWHGEVERGHALEKKFSLWVLRSRMHEQWEQKWLGTGISVLKEIPMVGNKAYSKTEQNANMLPSV